MFRNVQNLYITYSPMRNIVSCIVVYFATDEGPRTEMLCVYAIAVKLEESIKPLYR